MASTTTASYAYTSQNSSSQRSVAMVLVLVSAIVLSPLYANPRKAVRRDTMRQNGALMGLFFPWFLLDLSLPLKPLFIFVEFIICIAVALTRGDSLIPSSEPSWVLRIGSSCWGLGGVLVMLMLVLSWQGSVHEFLWR